MVKPQYLGKKFVLFSSFELSKDLKQMLRTVMSLCASGNPADWYDVPRLKRMVRLQHECRTRFNAEAAAANAGS